MNLKNFVIASLVFHFVFLLVVWFGNWKTAVERPDKPLIAKIVPLKEIVQPPIQEVPEREITPTIRKAPPIEHDEPPQTMEGDGGPAKKGSKKSSEKKIDKHSFDSKNLKIAEKKAVEDLIQKRKKEFLEGKPGEESEGEITFSTHEFKYYGYKMRLKEKIESIWKYPPEAAEKGIYADLYIRFTILKDGELGAVNLIRTSGYKMLDDAALRALKDAAPFWPLPGEWKEESFTITGHFIYSLQGFYLR